MDNFNIYLRKDGRWEGRISIGRDENGKRRFKYFFARTRDETAEKMTAFLTANAVEKPPCALTFSQLTKEWFLCISCKVKESTLANYDMKTVKHLLPEFGDRHICSIKKEDIYAFIRRKQQSGLSPRYVSDLLVLLKTIFKFAANTYAVADPAKSVRIVRKKAAPILLLDTLQQDKLYSYLAAHRDLTTLGIALSAGTGIRIGELCALQWGDIDFQKRTLTVRKTIQRIRCRDGGRRTKIIITSPKSDSSRREIPVPDFLLAMLRDFRSREEDFVLSGSEKPVEPRTMQYRFGRILKNADLPSVHFHALRHIFASACVRLGFDVKALSELLGHSGVEITLNSYVHSSLEQKRKYMDLVRPAERL